ncbi:hypothetical protein R3X27_04945 [Tropicimonas sp. TH_r6]|uniref:hypothetical protein n=1 Tax=Tropicimonas sp. TH_r6 TaxID=3082085 RepID=UPI002954F5CF|nr:hypothetical protein [Tropicimonas sp. TH_r6]MDV7142025.1 hypothetical protein [Tropicimonas sp. TH_r6]
MDLNREMAGNYEPWKVYQMTCFYTTHHVPDRMITSAEWSLLQSLEQDREALLSAGKLLGGKDGLSLVEGLYVGIARDGLATHGVRRRLSALMALISLRNARNPGQSEKAFLAELDLLDPWIEGICLLTDRLAFRLAAISKEPIWETANEAG